MSKDTDKFIRLYSAYTKMKDEVVNTGMIDDRQFQVSRDDMNIWNMEGRN